MATVRPSSLPLAALLASALGPACAGLPEEGREPTRPSGDDDSGGDPGQPDDDLPITAVTFAAAMDGTATSHEAAWTDTAIDGVFQFVYWADLDMQDLVCRQRYAFSATASFDGGTSQPCTACVGRLDVATVQPLDPTDFPDGCGSLPADLDLSFLLAPDEVGTPTDFRTLLMLDVDLLSGVGWEVGTGGLGVDDLVSRYGSVGLEVLHVGFVSSSGWLAQDAGLAQVAHAWFDGGWLPMFVVYAEAGTQPSGASLVGQTYLSTLWTVRVGDGPGVGAVE